jgi:polysaccharide biosynthesis protein PslG
MGYDNGYSPYTTEGRTAFKNYAVACVNHFKNNNPKPIWEIYNEPTEAGVASWKKAPGSPGTIAQQLAALINEVVPAMREADPQATIVGPAMASYCPENDLAHFVPEVVDFLHDLARDNALDKLDAVSFHPYRDWWPETARQVPEGFLLKLGERQ